MENDKVERRAASKKIDAVNSTLQGVPFTSLNQSSPELIHF